jgi:PAS domain S-box-containing protein
MSAIDPQSIEEQQRLVTLREYNLLDTTPDEVLDELTVLASQICETPMSVITLLDEKRQWFLANTGVDRSETPREQAFCNIAIQNKNEILEISDARHDPRVADNPLVTGDPRIRFYAGVPLVTESGQALGAFCVIDSEPRELTATQRDSLRKLAHQAMRHIEMRRQLSHLATSVSAPLVPSQRAKQDGDRTLGIFRRKIYSGFAVAIVAMILLAIVSYSEMQKEAKSSERVRHTYEVLGQIELLRSQMSDLESSARGYIAVGDEAYLGPYREASRDIPATLSRVGGLVSDNARQVERLSHVRLVVDDRLTLLSEGIRYRAQESRISEPLMAAGRTAMERVRNSLNEMQAEERRLLEQRTAAGERDASRTQWMLAAGTLGAFAIMFWLFANILRESSKRARIAAELEHAGALHRTILQSTNLSVVAVDLSGRITIFNRAAELLLRYRADEVVGRYTPAIFHEPNEVAERATQLSKQLGTPVSVGMDVFWALPQRGQIDDSEWTYVRKDGRRLPVQLNVVALRNNDGEIIGYVGIAADITQRKRDIEALRKSKEEAEEAARVKSAFLATMSHEIRTPMNGVIGMTSLLLNTPLSPDQREFTDAIRVSGESLLVVINDILDYSKIESGRMEFEHQPFDLQEALESTIELLALKAQEKHLDLMYLMDPDVPRWIYGDLPRLRQVLVNLLSNAVKFTERGEVFLYVKNSGAGKTDEAAGDQALTLEFSVRDSGIGISEEKSKLLFSAFTQVDSSISRKFGGTGLGLAISRKLAEGMGGEMWVVSREGEGATFAFTLPTSAAEPLAPQPEISHDAIHGKRVLLVDDNATNLRILGVQTEQWGMKPFATLDPSAAIAMVNNASGTSNAFDLIITDMHMPVVSGVRLAEEIHRKNPALPIVLLTSGNTRDGEMRGNFAATLTKPARQSTLHDAVMRAFHAQPQPAAPSRASATSFDDTLATRYPLRILLAEDNDLNQKLALRVLKSFGYIADVAANGYEVITALRRQPYDLVLMDVQMPEMDGLEATRQILRIWPDVDNRPRITAMSANAMREDVDAAAEAGMDDYVTKPISIAALRAALERCGEIKSKPRRETAAIADSIAE